MGFLCRRLFLFFTIASFSLSVVACGSGNNESSPESSGPLATVAGVGSLPPRPSKTDVIIDFRPPSTDVFGVAKTVGKISTGPRLLMIGDSILAAVSPRFSNAACIALVPLGWQVSVEAEIGQFIDLGLRVVNKKLPQGFDAAVVFLGTNYGKKPDVYKEFLDKILDKLAPRPVIIFTISEFDPIIKEVNDVILAEVQSRDNLMLIDWRELSKGADLLSQDRIHPTEAGNELLINELVKTLGQAPGALKGKCLPSEFEADLLPTETTLVGGESTTSLSEQTTIPEVTSTVEITITSTG